MANYKYIKREWKGGKWVYTYPTTTKVSYGKNVKSLNSSMTVARTTTAKNNTQPVTTNVANTKNIKTNSSIVVGRTAKDKFSFKGLKQKIDNKIDQVINKKKVETKQTIIKKATETKDAALKAYDTAYDTATKKLAEYKKKNVFEVDKSDYEKKIKQIAQTKEWKDIVARQDPEYVKKQPDGSVKYDIDGYLVKKKHPELDILDDLAYGRKPDINKIDVNAIIAGGMDYVKAGITAASIFGQVKMQVHKYTQGSYIEEERQAAQAIADGKKYMEEAAAVSKAVNSNAKTTASTVSKSDAAKAVTQAISTSGDIKRMIDSGEISKAEVDRIVNDVAKTAVEINPQLADEDYRKQIAKDAAIAVAEYALKKRK